MHHIPSAYRKVVWWVLGAASRRRYVHRLGYRMPLWQFWSCLQLRQEIAPDLDGFRDRLPQDHRHVHHQADMTFARPVRRATLREPC